MDPVRKTVDQKEIIHRIWLQRLFEQEVTEYLLTIFGHLVLLWFTNNTHRVNKA